MDGKALHKQCEIFQEHELNSNCCYSGTRTLEVIESRTEPNPNQLKWFPISTTFVFLNKKIPCNFWLKFGSILHGNES